MSVGGSLVFGHDSSCFFFSLIALCKCFVQRGGNELFFFVKCELGKLACTMPTMIRGYVPVLGEMERE